MPAGRPKEDRAKRQPIIEEVLKGIEQGIPLAEICRRDGFPDRRSIYFWMEDDADFASRFARARELGFDAIAEECFEIADDGTNDWVQRQKQDGSIDEVVNSDHIQRSKLRIETRLKLLAKWDPKRYGERQEIKHSGAVDLTAESDEALAKRLAQSLKGMPREAAVAFLTAKGIDPAVLDE